MYDIQDVNLTGKPYYRIGDGVFHGNSAIDLMYNYNEYNDTLLKKYLTNIVQTETIFDWNLVQNFADNCNVNNIKENILTLSLRLGDFKRFTSKHKLNELISNLKRVSCNVSINHVEIVTALVWDHVNPEKDRSMHLNENIAAVTYIINELKRYDINTTIYKSEVSDLHPADIDLSYLIKAKHLIISPGNFQLLAAICNRNNVYYGLDTPIVFTEPTGRIKTRIICTMGKIVDYYKRLKCTAIPHVDTTRIGKNTPLNILLEQYIMGIQ